MSTADEPLGKWWSAKCQVHGYHWPPLHATVVHHVHPRGMGGKDVASNKVEVCPTGHTNIHVLIDLLQDTDGHPTKAQTKGFTREELRIARQGYDEWTAAGRPSGKDHGHGAASGAENT